MQSTHYVTLAILLGAVALQIGGLKQWSDALAPSFVAGTLATLAAVLRAMFQPPPTSVPTVDVAKVGKP